jgi:hypothetical protein
MLGSYVWLRLSLRYPGKMRLRTLAHCIRADTLETWAKIRFTGRFGTEHLFRFLFLMGDDPPFSLALCRKEWNDWLERDNRKREWERKQYAGD